MGQGRVGCMGQGGLGCMGQGRVGCMGQGGWAARGVGAAGHDWEVHVATCIPLTRNTHAQCLCLA